MHTSASQRTTLLILCTLSISALAVSIPSAYTWDKYPTVRRDSDMVETIHGHEIKDPYRWLESQLSDESKAFINAQSEITTKYLDQYPYMSKFQNKLTEMYNFERFALPMKKGGYYYYWYNPGLLNQPMLLRQRDLNDGTEPEVFVDPNRLSDGKTASICEYEFSPTGKYFAYCLNKAGSDWATIHVVDSHDKTLLPDAIDFVKFSTISWTLDEQGFFYRRYPVPEIDGDRGTDTNANMNAKSYYHKLGTPQSEDILVWEDETNPKFSGDIMVSQCGNYIMISIIDSCSTNNQLWITERPLNGDYRAENLNWTKLEDRVDHASFEYLTNHGPVFYFRSNLNAPHLRIVKYDLDHPGFVEVVGEREYPLVSSLVVGNNDRLLLVYTINVHNVLFLYDLVTGTQLHEFEVDAGSSVLRISGDWHDSEAFYMYSGFTRPATAMSIDTTTFAVKLFKQTYVPGLDPDMFETHQKFYKSKDNTVIPMYIVHRKGMVLDGSNPTLMYGYGGFADSQTPMYNLGYTAFMKYYNGVVAIPNIRGGGEFGVNWHKAGALFNKQNVFDDFQWAAKYLIAEKYTSAKHLAIFGASNGGLLVSACMNQAPELFGAAVSGVGVHDMLRFHKFTCGHTWTSDFGSPDVKADFDYLLTYSPLHNVKPDTVYPASLLMTSDHDDRVVPLHSYKYIAELQFRNPNNPNPLLVSIERDVGHGCGKPLDKHITSMALRFSFIAMNTGAVWQGDE